MEIEHCKINSVYGNFTLFCFNYGSHEDQNILCFKSDKDYEVPIVRIQSACFTAEIFRSKDCDCHEQLETSLIRIDQDGGLLIYLLQDGRGAGIFKKIKGLRLGETEGLNTAEAYDKLEIKRDPRTYAHLKAVVEYFKLEKVNLLTNNPRKVKGLEELGVNVTRIPLEIEPTEYSEAYLKTKKKELGHMFSKFI